MTNKLPNICTISIHELTTQGLFERESVWVDTDLEKYHIGDQIQMIQSLVRRYTLGSTMHCERDLAVSKPWEAAAASEPENPAARLTAKGDNGPTSSSDLDYIKV